ncbi:MAG: CoB--CoM heterodisulfide reductase iron-sulfur subunit A family protein [Bacteroidales bacterium]|nr:CoB--CoM heterodisulfide reductase iron-sulfur subunit A family protein [Bacteroidales bacterium]
MAGITAAVELAEAGREVVLVEKEACLGGNVVRMNSYFPKFCPPNCGLEINYRRIRSSRRIRILTQSTVEHIEGVSGDFSVKIKTAPAYINDLCTACGKCAEVCPVERPNAFNYGFGKTKAAYLPHEMTFPFTYVIDGTVCLKEQCGKCVEVCDYNAIDLNAEEETTVLNVERIIIATGWKTFDAKKIKNLCYAAPNVVTNVELERLLAVGGPGEGTLKRPSDHEIPRTIAFVQCAGSRDENYLPYCSAVCCSASLKHALTISERCTDAQISIYYIDLRVSGRNEDLLVKAENNKNIRFIKGKIGRISESDDNHDLEVEAEDILSGRKIKERYDMVVLATGMVPNNPLEGIILTDSEGFLVENQLEGIVTAATCRKPMDVSESVKDATSAAVKSIKTNF